MLKCALILTVLILLVCGTSSAAPTPQSGFIPLPLVLQAGSGPPIQRWDPVGDLIQSSNLFPIEVNVPDTISNIGQGVQTGWTNIGQGIQGGWSGLQGGIANIGQGIQGGWSGLQGGIANIGQGIQGGWSGLQGGIANIGQGIQGGWANIGQGVQSGISNIGNIGQGIQGGIANIGQGVQGGISNIGNGFGSFVQRIPIIGGIASQWRPRPYSNSYFVLVPAGNNGAAHGQSASGGSVGFNPFDNGASQFITMYP